MSRISDIRSLVVRLAPSATISELHEIVVAMTVRLEAAQMTALRKSEPLDETPISVIIQKPYTLRYTKDGARFILAGYHQQYSMSSLYSFRDSLNLLATSMGRGKRTFAELVPDFYPILMKVTGDNKETASIIMGEAFAGLMRRYANRQRSGSSNDYSFKVTIGKRKHPCTFTLTGITFSDQDVAEFGMTCSSPELNALLGIQHRVTLPTPEAAARSIADQITSRWKAKDTSCTLQDSVEHICRLTNDDDDRRFFERLIHSNTALLRSNPHLDKVVNYFNGYSLISEVILSSVVDIKFSMTLRKQGVSYAIGSDLHSTTNIQKEFVHSGRPEPENSYWTKVAKTSLIKWCKKLGIEKDISVEALKEVIDWLNSSKTAGATKYFSIGNKIGFAVRSVNNFKLLDEELISIEVMIDGESHISMVPFSVNALRSQAEYLLPKSEVVDVTEPTTETNFFKRVLNKIFS